jgi:hypothetical protein
MVMRPSGLASAIDGEEHGQQPIAGIQKKTPRCAGYVGNSLAGANFDIPLRIRGPV